VNQDSKTYNQTKTEESVILGPSMSYFIGETFIDGQQRGVWCNSKIPITDRAMYHMNDPNKVSGLFTKGVSCYRGFFNGSASAMFLVGDMCILDALIGSNYTFFCE
jgi:hypothetical protein